MRRLSHLTFLVSLATLCILLLSCGNQTSTSEKKSDQKGALAGKWLLQARFVNGVEVPVHDRIFELTFDKEGTFQAYYQGDASQKWVRAGQGRYSYAPPLLTLYWESRTTSTLLVDELNPDRMRLHRGRTTVPMKDQEPDEIFTRWKVEKGPTK